MAPPEVATAWPDEVRLGELRVAGDVWSLTAERVELQLNEDRPSALSVDRITAPRTTLPFWLSARFEPTDLGWGLNGVLASGAGDVVLRFRGQSLGSEAGELAITSEPSRFTPDGLQPATFWQPLGEWVDTATGTIELDLLWRATGTSADAATLLLSEVSFATAYGNIGPIDGEVALDRLWPPRTSSPQTLRVEGLALDRLVQSLEMEALGAEGTIDADLRFSFTEDGRLFIDESVLAARGPGVLRYRPDQPPAALAAQGQSTQLVLQALADFRYETLRAIVRGYPDADVTVELKLRGANPAVYGGHPIELNVNLEAPILPLVAAGQGTMALPDKVGRAINEQIE